MFVKVKISRQQAENIITKKSAFLSSSKLASRKKRILPERLEVVYLPFYLFDVLVEKGEKGQINFPARQQQVTLSVDGLLGHAVLYADDALDVEKDPNSPAPTCDFILSPAEAAKTALDRYRGILLEHGLRTRSRPLAKEISEGKKILYPFWVGYFKRKKGYDFKALDAVSGEIQGVRMRRVFIFFFRKLGSEA